MKEIIISIVIALDCAWIAWLLYNYYILKLKAKQDSVITYFKKEVEIYKNKYKNAQLCIKDLIKTIKINFPKSTIRYTVDDEDNQLIEGNIAY